MTPDQEGAPVATTETTLERTIREEQEAHDAAKTDEPTTDEETMGDHPDASEDLDKEQLFDASDYEREDLAIQKVDGNQIDRIALKFSGTVYLNRSDPADVALYNKLKLGHDITLHVEAKTSGSGAKGATDREGDLDVVIGEKTCKVHTVYVPVDV